MANIKRLLNKSGWTGRELGIIELTNMAVMFKQSLNGKDPEPIIDIAQFQKMVNSINDPVQGRTYNGYISIHEWLAVKYNIAQTQMQQAQLQFRTIQNYIERAVLAEDVYRYIDNLPLIMTQKQYEDIKKAKLDERFINKETGKEETADIFTLMWAAIGFYLYKLQKEPRKANPLKDIRKKYINAPLNSDIILTAYNEVKGNGYWELEDGRRSDQMTSEEWQEALTTPEMRKILETKEANEREKIARRRFIEKARAIFNGKTEEEAEKEQKEKDRERGLVKFAQWYAYKEPPANLTKWDIIEEDILHVFYPCTFDGKDPYNDNNLLISVKDFKETYGELIDVLLADMNKRYFKENNIELHELTLEKWRNTNISYRKLYEMDFYGIKTYIENSTDLFNENPRAKKNGIAIVNIQGFFKSTDEKGYYKEPEIIKSLKTYSLEGLFPEAEEYAIRSKVIEQARETLLDSYYFIKGYNYVLDRIADIYDVPELKVFKMSLDELSNRIDAINDAVPILYNTIREINYTDKELQEKKKAALKNFFPPIDYKAIDIPAENKKQLEDLLQDFKAFKTENADLFLDLSCIRPAPGEGA